MTTMINNSTQQILELLEQRGVAGVCPRCGDVVRCDCLRQGWVTYCPVLGFDLHIVTAHYTQPGWFTLDYAPVRNFGGEEFLV